MPINRTNPQEPPEDPADRRIREAREREEATVEYRANARAVERRTAELRALRVAAAGKAAAAPKKPVRRRQSGQEIADKAGLFTAGKSVKRRVGI